MEHGRRRNGVRQARGGIGKPPAAQLADAGALGQHRLGRRSAQGHQHGGIDQFDEAFQKRHAHRHLDGRRRAVAGRPPKNGVGNAHLRSIQTDGGEHPVQQPPAGADEGQTLAVFLGARRLADEQHGRRRIAVDEHQIGRGAFQPAAIEGHQRRAHILDRVRRGGQRHGAAHRVVGRRNHCWRSCRRDDGRESRGARRNRRDLNRRRGDGWLGGRRRGYGCGSRLAETVARRFGNGLVDTRLEIPAQGLGGRQGGRNRRTGIGRRHDGRNLTCYSWDAESALNPLTGI